MDFPTPRLPNLEMGDALMVAALELERTIKDTLSRPGRGIVYGRHQASAPGDPPAPDTGILRNTIGVERLGETLVRIGSGQPYAAPLEFGTGTIAPRPFMRPSLDLARDRMTKLLAGRLKSIRLGAR